MLLRLRRAVTFTRVGEFSGDFLDGPGVDTVFPADLYDVYAQEGGESEYPDDVYSDAGQLCLGGEFGGQSGDGGVECLGRVSCYRMFAGDTAGDGDLL